MPRGNEGAAAAAAADEHNVGSSGQNRDRGRGRGRGRGFGRGRGQGQERRGRGQSSFHRPSGQAPLEQLEQQVRVIRADILGLESRVQRGVCEYLKQEIQQTQAELATHQREFTSQVEALRTRISAIDEAQHTFDEQLRNLQASMKAINNTCTSIPRSIRNAEAEIRAVNARLTVLRDDVSRMQREILSNIGKMDEKANAAMRQSSEMDQYIAEVVYPALNVLATQQSMQLQAQVTFLMQTVRLLADFAHRIYREMNQVRDATSMNRQADTFQPIPAFFAGPIPAPVAQLPLLQIPPSSARAAVAQARQVRAMRQGAAAAAAAGPGASGFGPVRGPGHR